MSEKKDVDERVVENKDFLVSCTVVSAISNGDTPQDILDVVPAESEDEAKDIVTAFFAERDYIVDEWRAVAEVATLRAVASAMSR